ncbi:MAG: GTP-binding protein [Oscillospiraceae bacterium]|nr:GTP-binding protein [Oscillospiraceae bacterium]
MTKIDIFSGFLGAGKTTLIRKLIQEAYRGEKLVLIENEFGDIAIDGGFLQDAGVQITEMNSGCICCTLVGDFTKALKKVIDEYAPDRILIEPSGVGKLSDVAAAVERVDEAQVGSKVTVVDAGKAKMYARNFGEFFEDQVRSADLIVLSRTDTTGEKKLLEAVTLLKALNPEAGLITTPWSELDGRQIREAMQENGLRAEMEALREEHEHHHHHHDDEDDEHEGCHHHHHDDEDEEHEHHHHHHDDEDEENERHHHHHEDEDEEHEHHHHHHDDEDDDHECCHHHHHDDEDDEHECCHHDHDHEHGHHHHHADEIFGSWGIETARRFSEDELRGILNALSDEARYGTILRAKGIVAGAEGDWIYFDYVPGEIDIRRGSPAVTGRLCVIGAHIKENALKELFDLG